MKNYDEIVGGLIPIKCWTRGVPFEESAQQQLKNAALIPIIGPHIAVMPDVHFGIGSTVGSVIPTRKAIIPASVSVDIGCGVVAYQTTLTSKDISDNGKDLFEAISKAVPHGGAQSTNVGNWDSIPDIVAKASAEMDDDLRRMIDKNGKISSKNVYCQLGTLGSGNHFIELAHDESDHIWIMIHSGSRGIGNKIGSYFIEVAKKEMERLDRRLPDKNLAWLDEGTDHFNDYVEAVSWAQNYALKNRELMMEFVIKAIKKTIRKQFMITEQKINCHHNYVQKETHFGEEVYLTRKGAVSAQLGEWGVIPGSMGTRSYIVQGKGNPDSFRSCSHGAGRVMPRGFAKKNITLQMHKDATEGVFCRKDKDVIDESPAAYKNIDNVMEAQKDLVEVKEKLKQIVCIKG